MDLIRGILRLAILTLGSGAIFTVEALLVIPIYNFYNEKKNRPGTLKELWIMAIIFAIVAFCVAFVIMEKTLPRL